MPTKRPRRNGARPDAESERKAPSRAKLKKIAKTHKPPQEWYEEDTTGLYGNAVNQYGPDEPMQSRPRLDRETVLRVAKAAWKDRYKSIIGHVPGEWDDEREWVKACEIDAAKAAIRAYCGKGKK